MRNLYCFIALLFLSYSAVAQSADTARKDTSKHMIFLDAPSKNTSKPLYVIDGVIFKDHVKEIDPLDIVKIDVLKGPQAKSIYGSRGANGVIVITTRQFVINKCHKKFVAFSKSYSDYLRTHENKDGDFNYILNGFPLAGTPDEIIEKLHEVSSEDIISVTFLDKNKNPELVKSALIITAIKQ
ncbi:TonB-dependent outer membrane receptor, SusC/RagA subfamily, signature region [Mucilaginibacter sp. OK098]|nr:TonB-dependent outer membrane receptor, SusC/RagA subfamily, signature region [Mucilaginibacter sp. OK098]